jgi:NADH-quinone oxidoreductase subunit F
MTSAGFIAKETTSITVGFGTCGIASGAADIYSLFKRQIESQGLPITIRKTGCAGLCHREPMIELKDKQGHTLTVGDLNLKRAQTFIQDHVLGEKPVSAKLLVDPEVPNSPAAQYLKKQQRWVLSNCGVIDPENIDEYLAAGGYAALKKVIEMNDPDWVIDAVRKSGLRGRGGAGFPTGLKWRFIRDNPTPDTKYLICNADEGDPGAFMDRSVLESDPHAVLEGMAIAAFAIGQCYEGIIYCRAEYPLALDRLRLAIKQANEEGFLGENILGSGMKLKISLKEGAGAFVCGEETALIASIQGERGMPRLRPPYPAASGLWNRPTNINNVETFANIPHIIKRGADAYAAIGTEKSKGTKVFAIAGNVKRGGLIEVPMGISLREVIEDIAGGSSSGYPIKAAQLGGPSGGCVPASMFDTPVGYEELVSTGAIMGSGGMVVMDETACMIDIARFFLRFTQDESCGKCTFCRIGTRRMLEILERISTGNAVLTDLDLLESLAQQIRTTALCGLGQTAPNPVLTTLKYFRAEYEAHITERKCPAGKCRELTRFKITEDCNGCGLCAHNCPVNAIAGEKKLRHTIDQDKCTVCGVCRDVCKPQAVAVA